MTCNASSLMVLARCYQGMPKPVIRALKLALLCQWANHLAPPACTEITWSPPDIVADWVDMNGAQSGDLPTFRATADLATVTYLSIGGADLVDCLRFLPNLQTLDINNGTVTTLDLTGLNSLTQVTVPYNQLTTITWPAAAVLNYVDMSGNDWGNNPPLPTMSNAGILQFQDCTSVAVADFSPVSNITEIHVVNSGIVSLSVSNFPNLSIAILSNNLSLIALDVSLLPSISILDISVNPLLHKAGITGLEADLAGTVFDIEASNTPLNSTISFGNSGIITIIRMSNCGITDVPAGPDGVNGQCTLMELETNALPAATVSNLLCLMDNLAITFGFQFGEARFQGGTNGHPDAAGIACANDLILKFYTVNYN